MSSKLDQWKAGDAPSDWERIASSADLDQPSADQLARLSNKLERVLGPEWSSNAEASTPDLLHTPAGATGAALKAASSSLVPLLAVTTALVLGLGAAYFGLRPRADEPPPLAAAPAIAPAPTAAPAPPPPAAENGGPESVAQPAEPAPAPAPAPAPSGKPVRVERTGGLGEELKQLEAIRRTLARDPRKALAATERHARRFSHGALGPERELLKIEALLRLDRDKEAWQLASRALSKPHPYQAQILQLMAAEGR